MKSSKIEGVIRYAKNVAVAYDLKYLTEKSLVYYKGEVENGKFKQGVARFKDGKEYVGVFKDDLFHGKGMLRKEGGKIVYEGDFENGKYSGKGCLIISKNGLMRLTG